MNIYGEMRVERIEKSKINPNFVMLQGKEISRAERLSSKLRDKNHMKVHHLLYPAICIILMAISCQKEPEVIKVESVTLNTTSLSMDKGETQSLMATVSPSNADNKKIIWSSSNSSVATVDDRGTVTAIATGTATITARLDDGGKTATCAVTVKELSFTISSIGSTSVAITKVGNPDEITLEYRKGSGSWNAYTIGNSIDLGDGEFIQFRAGEGGNAKFSKANINYYKVVVSGSGTVKVSGNIMSLLDKIGEGTTMPNYGFNSLFHDCGRLIDVSKLKLPATTLADYCYDEMFAGCTSLQTAPELPATNLADYCYFGMFWGCTSLQAAPELPATTLADYGYARMFEGCTSLKTAPQELPATTLADCCYAQMFSDCPSLQTAPKLLATTLADYCYVGMFSDCPSLQTVPKLPATTLADYCYAEMFWECTSLQTAPELPATTLDPYCYLNMFYGCSNLNYVKALFETTPSDSYTYGWLDGVSSTGTFVKSKNATWDVAGPDGIPEGWTVQIAE